MVMLQLPLSYDWMAKKKALRSLLKHVILCLSCFAMLFFTKIQPSIRKYNALSHWIWTVLFDVIGVNVYGYYSRV